MAIKSVSTQQNGTTIGNAVSLQVSGSPIVIFDIEGEVNSTTATPYYIQIHKQVPVSGATVPYYSRLVVAANVASQNNAFRFNYRPLGLDTATLNFPEAATTGGSNTSPVYISLSTTDNVYTNTTVTAQVSVVFEDTYVELATQKIAGDTTTGVDALTVFTDPGATHDLLQIQVSNSTANLNSGTLVVGQTYTIVTYSAGDDFTNCGAPGNYAGAQFIATVTTPNVWTNASALRQVFFLMLFASSPVAGQFPLQQFPITVTSLVTFRFDAGLNIQSVGAPTVFGLTASLAFHTGCYLAGSKTTQFLTATTGTNWTMKAWYL